MAGNHLIDAATLLVAIFTVALGPWLVLVLMGKFDR